MEEQVNKPFKPQKSGKKIIKKNKGKTKKDKNLKAFSFQSVIKTRKIQKRNADRAHKREHAPIVNRTTSECIEPPVIVAVVGPRQTGKSTLIKNLVKHYSKRIISDITGPITVVSGKKRRLTFFECPNDINAMVDLAKIADLVLLLIDANQGFEMETFEFINILQTHGFPKVLGILTHLDKIKQIKNVYKTKKEMKKRFWKEVYPGAKLFYLSQMKYGKYLNNEVKNLARFISVMKFRPLVWRNSHPFVLSDRFEDITDATAARRSPKMDRVVSFYGFVRGTNLHSASKVHLMGVGDFNCASIRIVDDPCPLPDTKSRRITEMERKIFAPLSNVGDIICDEDAIYIEVKEKDSKHSVQINEGETILEKLKTKDKIGEDKDFSVKLFSSGTSISKTEVEKLQAAEEKQNAMKILHEKVNNESNVYERMITKEEVDETGKVHKKVLFKSEAKEEIEKIENSGEDDEERENEIGKVVAKIKAQNNSLLNEIYAKTDDKGMESTAKSALILEEKIEIDKEALKNRFYVGKTKEENSAEECEKSSERSATENPSEDTSDKESDSDYGTVEKPKSVEETTAKKKKVWKIEMEKRNNAKKSKIAAHEEANRKPFENGNLSQGEKAQLRGFLPGTYVRMVLKDVPYEFVTRFDKKHPIVLGGCLPQEEGLNFVRVKLRKHRWHNRVLKSGDAMIVSMGWRRFQTMPVFSVSDANGRERAIKYSPEHSHCTATFWGPVMPQGTGLFCFVGVQPQQDQFQIAATGVLEETDSNFKVMKKLKLVGEPQKIEKNTAFVKGMFNSVLEAAKFEGAAIRTVSGIRGTIKKALTNADPGVFRATFEDKILFSDLIFLRCWVPVELEKFYNPLTLQLESEGTLLLPAAEVRKKKGVKTVFKADSVYQEAERADKVFAPISLPGRIQKDLPFASKPKLDAKKPDSFERNRPKMINKEEQAVNRLISRLGALKNESLAKKKRKRLEAQQKKEKEEKKLAKVIEEKNKEKRKRRYIK